MPRSVFATAGLADHAVRTCRLERGLAEHLVHHGDPARRCALAGNPHLGAELVGLLTQGPDRGVRSVVTARSDLAEDQRAGIPIDFDPRGHHAPLGWVTGRHHGGGMPARVLVRLLRDPETARVAAQHRQLPAVVERMLRPVQPPAGPAPGP
ncbi:hypothetical protein FRZ03_01915 [Streptomyces misionensis]|uniref:Uncharacterized protein n=1 Tax=Streptomyces misionensis TaxID=67331 RepID=A0A5C6K2U7_9ACTN|nr:hypothetical protein [Streptomyces misionensis]TWV57537.1 hypothetical protein FRZ03_01915 [Streptomyces misionensis]